MNTRLLSRALFPLRAALVPAALALSLTQCAPSSSPPGSAPEQVTSTRSAMTGTLSVECVDTPCQQASGVTVTYANLPGTAAIGIQPTGPASAAPFVYQIVPDGSGTITFQNVIGGAPGSPAPLVARATFPYDATIAPIESDPFQIDELPPTISLKCSTSACARGDDVIVDFTNLPGYFYGVVTLAPVGLPDNALEWLPYQFTDWAVNGELRFKNFPPNVPLVAKAFRGDFVDWWFNEEVAASDPSQAITLTGPGPTLSLQCSDNPCLSATSTVTLTYANMPGYLYDMIAIAPVGAPNALHLPVQYTSGQINGTFTFKNLPANVPLEPRAFAPFDFTQKTFPLPPPAPQPAPLTLVGPPPSLTVQCTPSPCTRASAISVAYANMPGYPDDVITLAPFEGSALVHTEFQYTGGAVSGW